MSEALDRRSVFQVSVQLSLQRRLAPVQLEAKIAKRQRLPEPASDMPQTHEFAKVVLNALAGFFLETEIGESSAPMVTRTGHRSEHAYVLLARGVVPPPVAGWQPSNLAIWLKTSTTLKKTS